MVLYAPIYTSYWVWCYKLSILYWQHYGHSSYICWSLPSDTMKDWVPMLFDKHVTINMGNQYFTDWHNQTNKENVAFKQGVDPDGILMEAMASDFIHTAENKVEYFELIHTGCTNMWVKYMSMRDKLNWSLQISAGYQTWSGRYVLYQIVKVASPQVCIVSNC